MAPQASARATGHLTATTWLPLILQRLAQAAGAQTRYHTTTRSGGSIHAATGNISGKIGNKIGKDFGNISGNKIGNVSGNKIGNVSDNDGATSADPTLSAAQVAAIVASQTGAERSVLLM